MQTNFYLEVILYSGKIFVEKSKQLFPNQVTTLFGVYKLDAIVLFFKKTKKKLSTFWLVPIN